MSKRFSAIATAAAHATGHWIAFTLALCVVAVWIVTGPIFGFSDTWQLVINTGTTIVTFLLVFLIQHTQNTDQQANGAKLDELIRAVGEARNAFIDLEDQDPEEIAALTAAVRASRGHNTEYTTPGPYDGASSRRTRGIDRPDETNE